MENVSFLDPFTDGGFSSIEDIKEYASDISDISNMPCLERDAAGPQLRSPTWKKLQSARGGKKVLQWSHLSKRSFNSFDKKFALLTLQSSASSLSLDFGNCGEFASPSSKALSEDSTRARVGSYHLTADKVTLAHNLRRLSDFKQGKKLAKADKKRRKTRSQ